MANQIQNDNGQWVTAIGAPGSRARVVVQYPKLIERLNALYNSEAKLDEAVEAIRSAGVTCEQDTRSLLWESHYGENPHWLLKWL